MRHLLDAALGYADRGWAVFPLHGIVNGACTCGRGECSSPGKHPLVRRGLYEATSEVPQIHTWWRQWRMANIGIATGQPSGIVVIDVDLPTAVTSLGRIADKLAPTLTGLTGGGGLHLLYRARSAERLRNRASGLPGMPDLAGIDLRGDGGYVVAPPSVHRSGNAYSWLDPTRELRATPAWLKDEERPAVRTGPVSPTAFEGDGTPYGLAVLRDEIDRLRAAQVGTRNHELNRCAFVLAQLAGGGELLEATARSAAQETGLAIGLDEWECNQTIDSAFDAGLRQPRVAPHRQGKGVS